MIISITIIKKLTGLTDLLTFLILIVLSLWVRYPIVDSTYVTSAISVFLWDRLDIYRYQYVAYNKVDWRSHSKKSSSFFRWCANGRESQLAVATARKL